MTETPLPLNAAAREDFHEARFQAFRPFAIRLGFFIACMPLASLVPHWFLDPAIALHLLPVRILGTLAWLVYPVALTRGVSRKVMPWLLYGPVLSTMLLILWGLTRLGASGADYLWVLLYFFIFTPMLGMPFRRRENAIGVLILLLVPNGVALAWPGLGFPILRFNVMVFPVAFITLYLQRLFTELLEANYAYRRRIEEMAHRDALTGAFNRRYFMEAADLLLKQSRRSQRPLCLVILDIDHFKSVNDRFGHGVGDLVIRETARALTGSLRETDLVARLGGEEFVALLPDSDIPAGFQAAERARIALENTAVAAEGLADPVRFTASLGLAQARPEGETVEALLERADQALYRAKRGGRNQTATGE